MKWLKINTVLLAAVLSSWVPFSQADTQFRVIVDASGSMVISDPDKLTAEALRLISNLAPEEEATLGIWLFGEQPRVLLPEARVNNATKAKLASYVDSYVTQDVQTDLEAILKLLLETPDAGSLKPGFARHWILVTDGMVDLSLDESVNRASRDRILTQITAKLEDRGIHLHTVSMTGYSDKNLLETLSIRTNATYTEVAIPEDLLDTFDRIFTQAEPSDELPFDGNRFNVDDSIKELTLVIFHENGVEPRVIQPDGTLISQSSNDKLSLSRSDHYTLMTIREPAKGEWRVNNVDLERSSIRIITDLSAKATMIPPVIFQNEPISSTIFLTQSGKVIKDDQLLGLVTVNQSLYRLNGEQKEQLISYDLSGNEGQYKQRIEGINEPGNYELVSVVNGKTFSRQLSQYFILYPAIQFEGASPGGNLVAFSAKPVNLKLNLLRSSVTLEFTFNNGTTELENMPLVGQGYWEKLIPVSPNDNVKVRALLKGVTQAGQSFEYWTPVWHYTRQGNGAPIVSQGERAELQSIVAPVTTEDKTVTPVSVLPAISVVDEASEETLGVPTEDKQVDSDSNTDNTNNVAGLSKSDWILYAVLNLGALAVLAGGFFLYRRFKKDKSSKVDDLDDV